MTFSGLPTFAALQLALNDTAYKLHPSQAHGIVCGILTSGTAQHAAWEALITGDQTTSSAHTILEALYEGSAQQLADISFEFQPLLPPDDQPLPERAEALSMWCQGYLTGLKLVNIAIEGRKPSDTTEAINDMIEIAKMNYEAVVSDEEDESAYVELVEYVRVVVILIYEDHHTATTPPTKRSQHLH